VIPAILLGKTTKQHISHVVKEFQIYKVAFTVPHLLVSISGKIWKDRKN